MFSKLFIELSYVATLYLKTVYEGKNTYYLIFNLKTRALLLLERLNMDIWIILK